MKFQTIFIVVLITAYSITQAQVSKQIFDKAIDYLNCKAVELSLEKNKKVNELKQFKKKCDCQKYPDNETILNSIHDSMNKTKELSEEINKIKEEYNQNLNVDTAIKFITEKIFIDSVKYSNIFNFAKNRKKDGSFNMFKLSLEKELQKIIKAYSQPQEGVNKLPDNSTNYYNSPFSKQADSLTKNQPLNNRIEEENKRWFEGITFQIDIFSILISLFLSIVIINIVRGNIESELKDIESKINDRVNKSDHNAQNYSSSSGKIEELNKKIQTLEQNIKNLKDKINTISHSIPSNYIPPSDYTPTKADKLDKELTVEKGETFYLSTPNSDGSFNNSSASTNYKEGASIYRFTKISEKRAEFQIENRESSIKLALQFPDKNIDPVCEAENAFNPKAKTIITTNVGEAELVGDKWVNCKKAKIRYEN